MGRTGWIIVLVAGGVGIAIVIGLLANSQSVAEKGFCNNLNSLESSITNLTSLNPSTATQGDFQSDVSAVQSAWGDVKSSAQHSSGVNMSSLDSAWNDFSQAVQNVTSDTSVSDAEQSISQSADGLESAVKASIDSYDCSGSSSSS
jgi:hypothetical protein